MREFEEILLVLHNPFHKMQPIHFSSAAHTKAIRTLPREHRAILVKQNKDIGKIVGLFNVLDHCELNNSSLHRYKRNLRQFNSPFVFNNLTSVSTSVSSLNFKTGNFYLR